MALEKLIEIEITDDPAETFKRIDSVIAEGVDFKIPDLPERFGELMERILALEKDWGRLAQVGVVLSNKLRMMRGWNLTTDERAAMCPEEMEPLPRPIPLAMRRRAKLFADGQDPS